VQNCQDRFAEVAASDRFNFIGNVKIGKDISLASLKPHYDAILFAYGASKDKSLHIPGEDLRGVYSARAFVGWYNGLPEYADLSPDLEAGSRAVVIGNGNVALDVARILLSSLEELRKTDIAEHALEALSRNKVKNVTVLGRRGPMQVCVSYQILSSPRANTIEAAFTIKEIRELLSLPDVAFDFENPDLIPGNDYIRKLPKLEQRRFRLAQLLQKGSTASNTAEKSWTLASLASPKQFTESRDNPGSINGLQLASTHYKDDSTRFELSASVESTGETRDLPCSLAFRSIGYKSTALPGLMSDLGVPFDERAGIIPNDLYGRVLATTGGPGELGAMHINGCYCAGWVKRGPTGVIASTMDDAFNTADIIVKDWQDKVLFLNGTSSGAGKTAQGWDSLSKEQETKKAGLRRVSWEDWCRIDGIEKERGREEGRERVKFRRVQDMLNVLT